MTRRGDNVAPWFRMDAASNRDPAIRRANAKHRSGHPYQLFCHLLCEAKSRGVKGAVVVSVTDLSIDCYLDEEEVEAILATLAELGLFVVETHRHGYTITPRNWEKYQPDPRPRSDYRDGDGPGNTPEVPGTVEQVPGVHGPREPTPIPRESAPGPDRSQPQDRTGQDSSTEGSSVQRLKPLANPGTARDHPSLAGARIALTATGADKDAAA